MEILLPLVALVFIILIYNKQKSSSSTIESNFESINHKLDELKRQFDELQSHDIKEQQIPVKVEIMPDFVEPIPDIVEPELEILIPEVAISEVIIDTDLDWDKGVPVIPVEEEVYIAEHLVESNVDEDPIIPIYENPSPYIPEKSFFESFKEKNPDIEKFIGENLINKIGILILVLGISFFVKYAIDKDWINEPARVGIGMLSGAIVVGIAHRLRLKYAAFSSVFVGGAISIFYLTIGIAFHDYKLFSQTVAFLIMVVITIFGVFVSLSYNRKELAIIAMLGGFAVPFMVSTGSGNYQVLFTYIAILNIGMLIIAYFKKWNIVTLLAFILSVLIYFSWFVMNKSKPEFSPQGALLFATIMYFIFSIAPVLNNIRNKGGFSTTEYLIMLVNTFFYFGIGASIFGSWYSDTKGIFTLSLALYNLVFAFVLYKRFGIDRNAIYFLLGLALTFITLTIPFQFDGNYITLFWSCEAVLLLWLSQKSKIAIFKASAIIVQCLMLLSLFIDYTQTYTAYEAVVLQPFLNKIFITGLVSLGSLIAFYYLWKKENKATIIYSVIINPNDFRRLSLILAIVLAYFVGILEIAYQANQYIFNGNSAAAYPILYHYIFSVILVYYLFKFKKPINVILASTLAGLNILFFIIFCFNLPSGEIIKNYVYSYDQTYSIAFFIHYAILLCVAYFIYVLFIHRKESNLSSILHNKFALWIMAFCIVFILSNEVMVHSLYFSTNVIDKAEFAQLYPVVEGRQGIWDSEKYSFVKEAFSSVRVQVIKIGFPILWGILAFVFLIIGIKIQNKQVRIIALSLLGLTILKLFVYDINNVSETGKIIAFILLGVLILIISFVYQKIKKLVVDETKSKEHEENL